MPKILLLLIVLLELALLNVGTVQQSRTTELVPSDFGLISILSTGFFYCFLLDLTCII